MLTLKNINKTFNRTKAVQNINLEIASGSVFGLLGPNGAGKSTTIRMIMDIIKPDNGDILLDNHPIQKSDYDKIGYLPEERGLYQKSKLKETYFAELKGLSILEARHKADEFLKRFNLADYADRKIQELSKGNQQKVQFIISIISDPKLVILDEPFSGLDPVNQILLKDIIQEMNEKGSTVIFSTHQMEQVEKMCDDICLINKGQIILNGNLKEIKANYGLKTVEVHYSGEKSKLEKLNTIKVMELDESRLYGELIEEVSINDVLKELISLVSVNGFKLNEPSLEQIFIEQVKDNITPTVTNEGK